MPLGWGGARATDLPAMQRFNINEYNIYIHMYSILYIIYTLYYIILYMLYIIMCIYIYICVCVSYQFYKILFLVSGEWM